MSCELSENEDENENCHPKAPKLYTLHTKQLNEFDSSKLYRQIRITKQNNKKQL